MQFIGGSRGEGEPPMERAASAPAGGGGHAEPEMADDDIPF
jgi:hypothetical protein